jgi:hypothetical protein
MIEKHLTHLAAGRQLARAHDREAFLIYISWYINGCRRPWMSLDVNPEMGPVHGQIRGTGRVLPVTTDQKVGSSNLSGRAWSEGVEVFGPPQWVSILPSQFSRDPSADWLVRLVGWCGRSGAYGLGLYVDVWLGWPGPRCTDMNETRTELRRAGRCPQVQSQMS